MQYGVRTEQGYVHTEKHWTSVDLLFKGAHGFGMAHISAWGVLVYRENDEEAWKEMIL